MIYLQVILNGVFLGGFYVLMAQGLNVVFGVMKIVNLAHGAFIVLSGLVVYSLATSWGINPFLALPLVMVLAFAVGVGVQYVILERVKGVGHQRELLTLVATFGLSSIMVNIGDQIWGTQFKSVPYLQSSLEVGPLRFETALFVGFGLALALTIALSWWLRSTTTGKSLRATSQSPVGAAACGVNPRRMRLLGFGVGSGLAAAAGMLLIITQSIAPQFASSYTIIAFVVVALGGLGNYAGAALGGLVVGVAQTLAGFEFGSVAQNCVPYALLILLMLLRPQGLLPGKAV